MTVQLRFLYIMDIIRLPAAFFTVLPKIFNTSEPLRINVALPKELGGNGLPDMKNYYKACQLARLVDWHINSTSKDWINLEKTFTVDALETIPWSSSRMFQTALTEHLLIGLTMHSFHIITKTTTLSSAKPSLADNPDISHMALICPCLMSVVSMRPHKKALFT